MGLFDNSHKATWINIWVASSEKHWFNPDNHNGTRVEINGVKKAINWDEAEQVDIHLKSIKEAGVDTVLFDLTNGFHDFIMERSKRVGRVCRELGLKFAFAAGNTDDDGFEQRAELTYKDFCGEDAEFNDCYLKKDGKPLLVLYVVREQYESLSKSNATYLSKFTRVWASGEDPDINKWGWQLSPDVATVASDDAMYVTSSLRWDYRFPERWHKSAEFLDYNLLKAYVNSPKFLIVGSYDDVFERNSWMLVDTTDAGEHLKQKDIFGNVSESSYYERVCDWLKGKPKSIEGGLLADGAYKMLSSDGKVIGTTGIQDLEGGQVECVADDQSLNSLIWLYHLGDNYYRISRLSAGKSLKDNGQALIQGCDENCDTQKWQLSINQNGQVSFKNLKTGRYIGENGLCENQSEKAFWSLKPDLTMDLIKD